MKSKQVLLLSIMRLCRMQIAAPQAGGSAGGAVQAGDVHVEHRRPLAGAALGQGAGAAPRYCCLSFQDPTHVSFKTQPMSELEVFQAAAPNLSCEMALQGTDSSSPALAFGTCQQLQVLLPMLRRGLS